MVHTKNVTKYVVSYEAYVTVELNGDLQVIGHHIEHCQELDRCYYVGDERTIDLYPDRDAPEGSDDYSAVMGNAASYVNGKPIVFGIGMDNDVFQMGDYDDEPF